MTDLSKIVYSVKEMCDFKEKKKEKDNIIDMYTCFDCDAIIMKHNINNYILHDYLIFDNYRHIKIKVANFMDFQDVIFNISNFIEFNKTHVQNLIHNIDVLKNYNVLDVNGLYPYGRNIKLQKQEILTKNKLIILFKDLGIYDHNKEYICKLEIMDESFDF